MDVSTQNKPPCCYTSPSTIVAGRLLMTSRVGKSVSMIAAQAVELRSMIVSDDETEFACVDGLCRENRLWQP
jgi:hypothetical protein